jgi:OTT_1508-like deaminase
METILQLNRARINARLKPRKGSRHIVLEGLQSILRNMGTLQPQTDQFKMLVTRFQNLCQSLQQYHQLSKQSQDVGNTKNLVIACYSFCSAINGISIKSMLICAGIDVDGPRGDPHIRQIGKIAAYYHVVEMLVAIASSRAFRTFCLNISTRYVQAYSPTQSTMASMTDGCGGVCPVHAEVQLVIEFDARQPSRWRKPRVIGSSKAACFLCELFLAAHGDYFVPETHGKLTPRWTIPDLADFTASQVTRYRNIIGAMNQELRRLAKISHPKRLDPAMSWAALSQLNMLPTLSRSMRLVSETSIAQCEFAAVQRRADVSGSQISTILQETKCIADGHLPGEHTELLREVGGVSTSEVVDILSANSLECKSKNCENMQPVIAIKSHAPTAEQYSTINKEILGSDLPDGQEPGQARPFMNLDFIQRDETAEIIRGHEGRTSNVPSECDMSKQQQLTHFDMAHSDGTSRWIDFHDLELFFDVEFPAKAQISIFSCSDLGASKNKRVVNVDKLNAGEEVVLDISDGLEGDRAILLSKRSRSGVENWWKILMSVNV